MAVYSLLGFTTVGLFIVTFVLVVLLVRCWGDRRNAGSINLPPGPTGWPVLGCIPKILTLMMIRGLPMQDVFDELAKQYGPVYSMTVAGKRVVVVNSFETIKEVLHHPDMNDRPTPGGSSSQHKPTVSLYQGTGVLYSSGDAWRDQRKFSLSILRDFGVGKRSFENQISVESSYLIDEIRAFNGRPFDPTDAITYAVSNVINVLTFGKRYEYTDPEFKRLLYLLDQRMANAGKEFLVMTLPMLLQLPFGPGHEVKTVIDEIRQRLNDIIEEHCCTHDPDNTRDFIDAYLSEIDRQENSLNDQKGGKSHFNRRNMVQTVEDLFLGGTQTTTTTLRWALLYLVAFPSVQNNIQEELDRVVGGDRLPKLSDKPHLHYVVATINEIQRYACITYILGVRATYVQSIIGGFTIPARTALVQNIWSVSRDETVWKDPLEFRPERFLDDAGHVIKREEQLAFGAGRRSCMGENIAKTELFIFLTHILHRFHLTNSDEGAVNINPKPGGVLKPFPYQIRAAVR